MYFVNQHIHIYTFYFSKLYSKYIVKYVVNKYIHINIFKSVCSVFKQYIYILHIMGDCDGQAALNLKQEGFISLSMYSR